MLSVMEDGRLANVCSHVKISKLWNWSTNHSQYTQTLSKQQCSFINPSFIFCLIREDNCLMCEQHNIFYSFICFYLTRWVNRNIFFFTVMTGCYKESKKKNKTCTTFNPDWNYKTSIFPIDASFFLIACTCCSFTINLFYTQTLVFNSIVFCFFLENQQQPALTELRVFMFSKQRITSAGD